MKTPQSSTSKIRNQSKALVWLRRDLRVFDHSALAEATRQFDQVIPVFVFDINILSKLKDKDDRRVNFLVETISELREAFHRKGGHLVVQHGDPVQLIPKLARSLDVQTVICGKDYQGYPKLRDRQVFEALKSSGINMVGLKDHVIFESREVLTAGDSPFKVFTPYKNAWLKKLTRSHIEEREVDFSKLCGGARIQEYDHPHTLKDLGFQANDLLITPGEKAGRRLLANFGKRMEHYKRDRDFPSIPGTSMLSMHLRFGTVCVRECARMALASRSEGAKGWLSELIWRDFYQMILDQFPHVEKGCFKKECDSLEWPGHSEHFDAWIEGKTGFPLVDAAMRHFAKTGWMHNRLRMVVASFLTKDLLLPWRQGERYFAQKLLDYDCAANNGGWQWSASTGCDAQPYFRIFNPFSQSEKFDPDGDFIREHIPELKHYDNKHIHRPHEAPPLLQKQWGCVIGRDYPFPIVDHAESRDKALAMFKKLKP